MMEYRGYIIYINDYNYGHHKNYVFLFHNTNDCDECVGTGSSIEDCKEQIDEKLEE